MLEMDKLAGMLDREWKDSHNKVGRKECEGCGHTRECVESGYGNVICRACWKAEMMNRAAMRC